MEFGHLCGRENLQRNVYQIGSQVIKTSVAAIGNKRGKPDSVLEDIQSHVLKLESHLPSLAQQSYYLPVRRYK